MHALYPGSFDPPTNGHLDLIRRAAALFPQLTVAVVVNPQKRHPLFTLAERETMIRESITDLRNVTVAHFGGLLADFVRAVRADVIVKGLRVVSDFESEMAVAHLNESLCGVESLFLMSGTAYSFISSSMVKEAFSLGADMQAFVPENVVRMLTSKRNTAPTTQ